MIYSLLGFLLGLIPGFHPNLLINLKLSPKSKFELAFSSLFSSIFPAFFGAPNSSLAPAFFKRGKPIEYLLGILFATGMFLLTFPLYTKLVTFYFSFLQPNFKFLLSLISLFLFFKFGFKYALFFILSGIYGILAFNSGINVNRFLLVHFSSMFGLVSFEYFEKGEKSSIFSYLAGTLAGIIISLIPALTLSQALAIALLFLPASYTYSLLGSAYASSFLFCFASLAYFGKGRSAIVEQIGYLPISALLTSVLISTLLFLFTLRLRIKTPPEKIGRAIVFINMLVFGKEAVVFAPFSYLLGAAAKKVKARPSSLLGSLMLPTIAYYINR